MAVEGGIGGLQSGGHGLDRIGGDTSICGRFHRAVLGAEDQADWVIAATSAAKSDFCTSIPSPRV